MITRIEWKNGLWIAHMTVNGRREEAVSRRGYVDLMELATRILVRARNGVPA